MLEKRKRRDESMFNDMSSKWSTLVDVTVGETSAQVNSDMQRGTIKKGNGVLENSIHVKRNVRLSEVTDESFLEMERQCNLAEKQQQQINDAKNDTQLFDIEPPSELWEESVLTPPILECIRNEEKSIEMSPVKLIGLIRPSTIIEETSSQFSSVDDNTTNKNEHTASSNQSSTPTSPLSQISRHFTSSPSTTTDSIVKQISPLELSEVYQNEERKEKLPFKDKKNMRNRRETIAFKKRKYKFFTDENESNYTSRYGTPDPKTPQPRANKCNTPDLINLNESIACDENSVRNEFNDTIEAMDFFMEEGKRLIEQTPINNKNSLQQSMLETPLFSCKRSRLLSEMAAIEMMPLSKRGPLLNLLNSPDTRDSQRLTKQ